MTTTLLETFGATKRYRSGTVVDPASLRVLAGRVHGLLGPNGAGKTTLLHMLVGLLEPSAGDVLVREHPISDPATRVHIGFAPDDLPLPAALTGREFLVLHDRIRGRDDRARSAALAALFGIDGALDRQIDEYSHGMRRKLQFVAAVMHRPSVLVLDEPFRGLDPRSALVLRRFIASFVLGPRAVVIATHDLVRAERDCHWLWLIDHGEIAAEGPPAELVAGVSAVDLESAFALITGAAGRAELETRLLAELLTEPAEADR